jgi:hypothetical protein
MIADYAMYVEVLMKDLTKTATAGGADRKGDRNKEQDVLRPEDLARVQNAEQESTPPDIIIEN